MTRWAQVRDIFERALDLDAGARERFLHEHCDAYTELRDEVEALLAKDAAADPFLDRRPEALTDLPPGTRFGPWVVQATIASGGMGTVYRGARADAQFEKTVAIKLIKAGMDSAELLARFENERRVLAELDSPGIARLLDAGAAADSRPFFVMEFVDGQPIDAHAADQELDVRARITLFCEVCDAVHSAHQRLVVHRTIHSTKMCPAFVIVTLLGIPGSRANACA